MNSSKQLGIDVKQWPYFTHNTQCLIVIECPEHKAMIVCIWDVMSLASESGMVVAFSIITE